MAQLPKGGLVRGHDKRIHGSCAIYFPGGVWLLNHIPAAGKHTSLRCESDPIKSECINFRFCMDFQNLGSRASPGKDWLKVQGMRIVMKTARSRIVEGVDFQWLFLPSSLSFKFVSWTRPNHPFPQHVFFCQSTKKEGSEWTAPSRNIYYDSFTAEVGELGYGGTLSECELRSEAEPQSPGFAFGTSSDCTVTWRNIFVSNHGKPMRKSIKLKVKNMQIQHFERWLKGVDKGGFSVTLGCFTRGFPKVYMNNGQTPSSFQAGIGWMGIFREIFWMSSWWNLDGQVPSTGIVDSNYGNGEVKQVGLIVESPVVGCLLLAVLVVVILDVKLWKSV